MSSTTQGQFPQNEDFGDKLAFTVGFSYLFGFSTGLVKGLKSGLPKSWRMPKKLILNNFFNTVGKQTSRFGNAFAAAGFMFFFTGHALNFFFEEQLDYLTAFQKNMLCGATTGAIYKSTLGLVPSAVGGLIGASIIAGLTLIVERGNRSGMLAFEVRF